MEKPKDTVLVVQKGTIDVKILLNHVNKKLKEAKHG